MYQSCRFYTLDNSDIDASVVMILRRDSTVATKLLLIVTTDSVVSDETKKMKTALMLKIYSY